MRTIRTYMLVALLLGALVACSDDFRTPSEALRLTGSLANAVINEPYDEAINATGGLRPYLYALASGDELPPGLTLRNGRIEGTPTELGSHTFTITVSDGNLSQTFETYTLRVTELPPPRIQFGPPNTEVRGTVTLHVRVSEARNMQGVKSVVRFDPEVFALAPDSVSAKSGLVWHHEHEPGVVQFDYARLGKPLSGSGTVYSFTLQVLPELATLELRSENEFASLPTGSSAFTTHVSSEREGRAYRPPKGADE